MHFEVHLVWLSSLLTPLGTLSEDEKLFVDVS